MKDQPMPKLRLLTCALAGASVLTAHGDTVITEDFSSDPLRNGWSVFGEPTCSSGMPPTRTCGSPGTRRSRTVISTTRSGPFLRATMISAWPLTCNWPILALVLNTNDTYAFEIALGFLNLAQATETNFLRGTGRIRPTWSSSPTSGIPVTAPRPTPRSWTPTGTFN